MKNILIGVIMYVLMFLPLSLFSQNYYLYVYTSDKKLTPNRDSTGVSSDEALNKIFKDFGVTKYYQSFPGAKTIELQNYYEIHFKGDIDSLEKSLTREKKFEKIYRSDYYKPTSCSNPVSSSRQSRRSFLR